MWTAECTWHSEGVSDVDVDSNTSHTFSPSHSSHSHQLINEFNTPHNDVREVNFRVGGIILTITPISFTVIAVSVLWTLFDAKRF